MAKERYKNKKVRNKKWMWGIGACLVLLAAVIFWMNRDGNSTQTPEGNDAYAMNATPAGRDETADTLSTEAAETMEIVESTDNSESLEAAFSAVLTEESKIIKVTTQYGTVEYPAAFSDVIQTRTEFRGGVAVLKFEGRIGDAMVELFDICYGEMEDEPLRQIRLEDGTLVYVYLVTYDPPQDMEEDELNTYYAAQEILNDVISSIMEAQ